MVHEIWFAAGSQAATSVRRQEPTVADEQLSYSSDVPEPRRASDGGDETTGTANVFSCRPIAAATGCRPAAAPGMVQRSPARTRASRTLSIGQLSASQSGGRT